MNKIWIRLGGVLALALAGVLLLQYTTEEPVATEATVEVSGDALTSTSVGPRSLTELVTQSEPESAESTLDQQPKPESEYQYVRPASFPKLRMLRHADQVAQYGKSEQEFLQFYGDLHQQVMSLLSVHAVLDQKGLPEVTVTIEVPEEMRNDIEDIVGRQIADYLEVDGIEAVIARSPELVKEIDRSMLFYGAKRYEFDLTVEPKAIEVPDQGKFPVLVLRERFNEYSAESFSSASASRFVGDADVAFRLGELADAPLAYLFQFYDRPQG